MNKENVKNCTLIETIGLIRRQKGFTKRKFAQILGVNEVTWCRIEGKKQPLSEAMLLRIAQNLDMSVEEIKSYNLSNSMQLFIGSQNLEEENANLRAEIKRLQDLLSARQSIKVVFELDMAPDELIELGLQDKIIQLLNK